MTSVLKPMRPIDHLVLPTASLDVARARLTALGFTAAPVGVHPFGTENACVYFLDGTFLEPLAVRDTAAAEQAVAQGNVFVSRDRRFRQGNGEEGFSALVFGTDDADTDHVRFVEAGLAAGDMLSFSRAFVDATGKQDTASFKLAFAADPEAPDAFFFTCERVNAPKVDRSALQRHANGVTRTLAVVATSATPGKYGALLASIAGASVKPPTESTLDLPLANGTLALRSPKQFQQEFGIEAPAGEALRLAAIVFGVADLALGEALFSANAIRYDKRGRRLVVPPASGQGAAFIFEEFS